MPEKLPKPKTCPCCGGELEHTARTIETIGRGGFMGRRSGRPFTKFQRPVHICRRCNIAVVIHRVPRELTTCELAVAGETK